MRSVRRSTSALLLLLPGSLAAQAKPSAAIPPTATTQSVSNLPSAQPVARTAAPSKITWNGSMLTVDADGEFMPELLGRLAHQIGMKITGGVPEEHVFGHYGPAPVQTVLAELFDGISINMMMVNKTTSAVPDLILTARTGSATPPSTRPASAESSGSNLQEMPGVDMPHRHGITGEIPAPPPVPEGETPGSSQPNENEPPQSPGNGATDNGSSANPGGSSPDANGQPESPNGVRTPEQIFEELRKRQQQSLSQ